MTEIWCEIPHYSLYEVSTWGNIRNKNTKLVKSFDIEKLKESKTRMRVYILNDEQIMKNHYLHRLVAQTFIENPLQLKEVNHKDGNPYNNEVSNLEWISREENMKHFHDNHKYEKKYMRRILLIRKCSQTNEENIEQTFECIEQCIEKLQLPISYQTLYSTLSNTKNKYKDRYLKKEDGEPTPDKKYCNNKYVGVNYNKTNKKYVASYKNKYIGSYTTEEAAARDYDNYLRTIYENHCVNFPIPNTKDTQAIVGKKRNKKENDENSYSISSPNSVYPLDNNRFLKYEDNNENIKYDNMDDTLDDVNGNDNEKIEWRVLKECPLYEISNTGLVKHKRLSRILQGYSINGYRSVSLTTETGNKLYRLVHRLVAETFIENDDPTKIYVDHIDTDIVNNHVSNLRWVTPKENMNNSITKQNISKGHLDKASAIYMIDITNGEPPILYKNCIECSQIQNIPYNTIKAIANFYNKENRDQYKKTYNKKYIFLYEEDMNKKDEYIKIANAPIPTNNNLKVPILQIDKHTGNVIGNFESLYQASKTLNINYTAISQVYNYWKYTDTDRPACYKLQSISGFIFKKCIS